MDTLELLATLKAQTGCDHVAEHLGLVEVGTTMLNPAASNMRAFRFVRDRQRLVVPVPEQMLASAESIATKLSPLINLAFARLQERIAS